MKQVISVILFLLVLFPVMSQEYKVCLSSVTERENAEYLSRGLEAGGLDVVFEPTVVFGRYYLRILSGETYDNPQEAVRAMTGLAGKPFIRDLGLDSLWIRVYPEGYPASGFTYTEIPVEPAPAPAAMTVPVPAKSVPEIVAAPPVVIREPAVAPVPAPVETVPEIVAAPLQAQREPEEDQPRPEGPPVPEEAPAAEPVPVESRAPAPAEPAVKQPGPVETAPGLRAEEAASEDLPEVPVPEAGVEPETEAADEPTAEPVAQDIPAVLEEVPSTPEETGSAQVTIRPKAVPEAPEKTMPEVPAVEVEEVPAPPKKPREVQAELILPAETGPVMQEEPELSDAEIVIVQPEEAPAAMPEAEPAEQPDAETAAVQPEEVPAAVPEADAGLPATDPDAVYEFHRDNFLTAYEYIRTFADEGISEEAVRLAGSIPLFLSTAEAILADFDEYMPDPLSNYEQENPEAGEIHLASKASFLENTYIPRARENLEILKEDIMSALESDAEWLASEYANIKHAPAALARIREYAESLRTIAPDDTDLLDRLVAILLGAEEHYAGLSESIADNRMPAEKYAGDDETQLKAEMAVLYEARYAGQRVEKVIIINEQWREETAAEIRDNRMVVGVYRYIQAALAVTNEGSETATVYTIGFRRTWTGMGDDFGPVELYSIGSSYPILPEYMDS